MRRSASASACRRVTRASSSTTASGRFASSSRTTDCTSRSSTASLTDRFTARVVKADVYAPDWRDPERVRYTTDLIDILSVLVPDDVDGGVSTVPLSYKAWMGDGSKDDWRQMLANVVDVAATLVRLRDSRGVLIHLDIEPEPDCVIETTDETISFFQDRLLPQGAAQLAAVLNVDADEARRLARRSHSRVLRLLSLLGRARGPRDRPEDDLRRGHRHRPHPAELGAPREHAGRSGRAPGIVERLAAVRRLHLPSPGHPPRRPRARAFRGSRSGPRPAEGRRLADPLPRAAVHGRIRRSRIDAGRRPPRDRGRGRDTASRVISRSRPTRGTCCPRG